MIEDYNELNANLESLELIKIKELLPSYLDKNIFDSSQLIPFLNNLFKSEREFRDERAKEINIKVSNFPYRKTIDEFDFSFQPGLSKSLIMDLMTLRFIESKENIIFVGLPGTGKTMLSTCIGIEASSNRRLKHYGKYKLLIIDELGFLPICKDDANILFQLIALRYEKSSTIVTTNIEFSKWGDILNDSVIATAILDRLLHHSTVINIDGPSYRMKNILNQ